MTFAERLHSLRTEKGITQEALGEAIGVSSRVVGYYETGDRFPKDPETLLAIARFFEVSLDYLLDNPVRSDTLCPSRYCYMKNMNAEDRRKVNDYIRFLLWQKRTNGPANE